MKNIFQIIKKNLKILIRSKSSALIIIFAPLLVILLAGVAFDNANVYGINIGVYSESYTDNVNSFIDKLSEREFNIVKYDNQDDCVQDISLGATHTCVVFPSDFSFDSNNPQEITYYIDYSKINLVYMITDTLSTKLTSSSQQISKNLTGVLVNKITSTQTELGAKKAVLDGVKSNQADISTKLTEIDGSISTLDLTSSSNASIGSVKSMLSRVRDDISTSIEAGKADISNAKKLTESSGASSTDKANITTALDEAVVNLNTAKSKLTSSSQESLITLGQQLDGIQQDVDGIKNKISSAATAQNLANQRFDEVIPKLNKDIENLGEVQSSLNMLISEIQGIQVTDPDAIATPITTDIRPVTTEQTYLNYLFPSLTVLVLMFIAILLGTSLVMMEKHSPAYFRNYITPVPHITYIIGSYMTSMLLVLIQIAIILGIASFFFDTQITPNILPVGIILILSGSFFTLMGMTIGYLFKSEETGVLASISLGSVMLFLSGVILPIESMPGIIRKVATFNPFVVSERVLRETLLFAPKLQTLMDDVTILLVYAVIAFILVWASQKIGGAHPLQKITYKHHQKQRAKATKSVKKTLETKKKVKKTKIKKKMKKGKLVKEMIEIDKELKTLK